LLADPWQYRYCDGHFETIYDERHEKQASPEGFSHL